MSAEEAGWYSGTTPSYLQNVVMSEKLLRTEKMKNIFFIFKTGKKDLRTTDLTSLSRHMQHLEAISKHRKSKVIASSQYGFKENSSWPNW